METIRRRSPEAMKEKMIEDVLENFNFDLCHYVMTQLKWNWYGSGGVPTLEDMLRAARERMEEAIKGVLDRKDTLPPNSYYFSSSGGFKATAWKNRYGHLEAINLEFVLTGWDSDGD